MTDLTDYISEETQTEITELFKGRLREMFEEYDIEYTEEHVNNVTDVFEEHWADALGMRDPEQWHLDQLTEQLKDDERHGNIGIIVGMASVRFGGGHPAQQLATRKMKERHE